MSPEELDDENDHTFQEIASAEGLTAREYFEKAIHRIYGVPREYQITEPHIYRGEE